ncbi:hypothetical protein CGLO_13665 [Colletotrichum gloeosporioides Cg-14]|uniref:Uncharacterized protein n=1 Tax=Colletotrichum gloeosporioides (strain Cg-14) TaxID=1237896 RepID=T0K5M9_COLGC|nr:hypothetical protein CGLO_13665 [Colletotrichum gloeosporioides Cg-14]
MRENAATSPEIFAYIG